MPSIAVRLAKWKLHRFYSNHPVIAKSLPPTAMFSRSSLAAFLDRYQQVYVKGNTQHTGKGIIKVWKTVNGGYGFVQVRGRARTAASVDELYRTIQTMSGGRVLVIQKAIDLAQINGRSFDIRVMMMRNGQRQWRYAGMLAKVHGPGSVVSNVARGGGYVASVERALAGARFHKETIGEIKRRLIRLSHTIIQFSEKYPFYSYQSGIDLAVDKNGKVWIIEVNLHNPSHGLFRKLADKSAYTTIRRLNREYLKHNKRLI